MEITPAGVICAGGDKPTADLSSDPCAITETRASATVDGNSGVVKGAAGVLADTESFWIEGRHIAESK